MAHLEDFIRVLEAIAPTSLAADWDNVGLLVRSSDHVDHIGLCIDLTESVLDELISASVDTIVAYHPPIFRGIKRLAGRTPTERIIGRIAREGINLYSPHTALDAAADGMNDWLLDALGPVSIRRPIEPAADPTIGMGRFGTLAQPTSLVDLIEPIKQHLGLEHLRLAAPTGWRRRLMIREVAVCPGAGGSLFAPLSGPDLFLTGEMRHHDVLAKVAGGAAVVLTDHTHTERGYLPVLAGRLVRSLAVPITISQLDDDPLTVV